RSRPAVRDSGLSAWIRSAMDLRREYGSVVRHPHRSGDLKARGKAEVIVRNLPHAKACHEVLIFPAGRSGAAKAGHSVAIPAMPPAYDNAVLSMYYLAQCTRAIALCHHIEVDRLDSRRVAGRPERFEPLDADLLPLVHPRLQELAGAELHLVLFHGPAHRRGHGKSDVGVNIHFTSPVPDAFLDSRNWYSIGFADVAAVTNGFPAAGFAARRTTRASP